MNYYAIGNGDWHATRKRFPDIVINGMMDHMTRRLLIVITLQKKKKMEMNIHCQVGFDWSVCNFFVLRTKMKTNQIPNYSAIFIGYF